MTTEIAWTDETWNPTVGCSRVSPGCDACYAVNVAHRAMQPAHVGLPAWFLRAYTDQGDTVFDPFMGSGSTLIAAEQEHRVGYGTEISPGYCDVICKRYQGVAGVVPTRDGKPHDFLAGSR